jgi:hypothetical protein
VHAFRTPAELLAFLLGPQRCGADELEHGEISEQEMRDAARRARARAVVVRGAGDGGQAGDSHGRGAA